MCNLLYTNKSKTHKQFYYLGAKCWNILPQPLRLAESAKTFSNTLKCRLPHNIEINERYQGRAQGAAMQAVAAPFLKC